MQSLTTAQKKIVNSKARFRTLRAGRRFGKSYLMALEMVGRATVLETKQAYIAPTYGEARDIMWDLLVQIAGNSIDKKDETRLELRLKNNKGTTSTIKLTGWDMKVADRMRGQKFHHIYLDEVAKMREFQYFWKNAVRPTLIDYRGGATFASTPRGFNHFYDLCNHSGGDWEHFHFTSYDNPHLKHEELDALKTEIGEDAVSQEIMAEFTKQQGLVYDEFDRNIHVKEEIPFKAIETIAGLDYGFKHPTAVLTIKTNGHDFYVEKEFYEVGRTHEEVADYVYNQPFNKIFPEPAEPALIEIMRRKSLPVREVSKDRKAGINLVKTLLRSRRVFVHPSCVGLIREFDMHVWHDKKDQEVVKENDDALDALRYAVYNYTPAQVVDLPPLEFANDDWI